MALAPSSTSRNRFRLIGFNKTKSLILFSICFSQDRLLFWGTPLDSSYTRELHHDRLLCAQPARLPTILSATRTLIECFMRTAHLICRLVDFFSVFVVFYQRSLKYSSTRGAHANLNSSVRLCSYACMRPRSLHYGLRLSGIRCLHVIG